MSPTCSLSPKLVSTTYTTDEEGMCASYGRKLVEGGATAEVLGSVGSFCKKCQYDPEGECDCA